MTFRTVKDWVHELRKNGTIDMVIAIAGNKCDLEDLREVRAKGKNGTIDMVIAIPGSKCYLEDLHEVRAEDKNGTISMVVFIA